MDARDYRIEARTRRIIRKMKRAGFNPEPSLRWRLFIATHPKGGCTKFGKRALVSP